MDLSSISNFIPISVLRGAYRVGFRWPQSEGGGLLLRLCIFLLVGGCKASIESPPVCKMEASSGRHQEVSGMKAKGRH